MPAYRTRILEFPVDAERALDAARHAVGALIGGTPVVNGMTVTGSVKVSVLSWGEELTITVSAIDGGSRVIVKSASRLPTQLIDWGRHRKNLNRLQHELETAAQTHAAVIEAG